MDEVCRPREEAKERSPERERTRDQAKGTGRTGVRSIVNSQWRELESTLFAITSPSAATRHFGHRIHYLRPPGIETTSSGGSLKCHS